MNLPKSLHTVTVLVAVATELRTDDMTARAAIERALAVLGYNNASDTYGLAAKAVRQLERAQS